MSDAIPCAKPTANSKWVEEALRQLAAAMAHEVRNPLNAMAIHAELLEARARKLPETESTAALRSIEVVRQEIDRIDTILERYLRSAGPHEAERTPVEIASLIGGAIERVKAVAEERGVRVLARVNAGMSWSLDAPAIGEAIDALLDNAVEASRAGGAVEVIASVVDEAARIEISDGGEGIKADALAKIFQLGFSTRGRAGIGLAVAKQIVKGHGGSIGARSDGAGRGATVRIELPPE